MAKEDSENRIQEPGLFVLFVAVVLGSGSSFVFATYVLNLAPAWVAIPGGAFCSVVGFMLGENVGDAIVFSIFFCLLVFVFLKTGPEIEIIKTGIIPIATGFCAGKLVYGIWKEIS